MMNNLCYICLSEDIWIDDDGLLVCDTCGEYYCYEELKRIFAPDCSYTYTIHYQHEGSRCYHCANQPRRKPLNRRDFKINYILRDTTKN